MPASRHAAATTWDPAGLYNNGRRHPSPNVTSAKQAAGDSEGAMRGHGASGEHASSSRRRAARPACYFIRIVARAHAHRVLDATLSKGSGNGAGAPSLVGGIGIAPQHINGRSGTASRATDASTPRNAPIAGAGHTAYWGPPVSRLNEWRRAVARPDSRWPRRAPFVPGCRPKNPPGVDAAGGAALTHVVYERAPPSLWRGTGPPQHIDGVCCNPRAHAYKTRT